jgi:N-acetyl-gamma-glutamylphosphate reductase
MPDMKFYPSPYMVSRNEPLPNTAGKRKDANEVTETTILNPKTIALSLDPQLNNLMHLIFAYFLKQIKEKTGMVGGGKRRKKRTLRKTRRKAKSQRHKAEFHRHKAELHRHKAEFHRRK